MAADAVLRRAHRLVAVLFLLTIPPAAVASGRGGDPTVWVYLPLAPLFVLVLSGVYLLVRPWVLRARARRAA